MDGGRNVGWEEHLLVEALVVHCVEVVVHCDEDERGECVFAGRTEKLWGITCRFLGIPNDACFPGPFGDDGAVRLDGRGELGISGNAVNLLKEFGGVPAMGTRGTTG